MNLAPYLSREPQSLVRDYVKYMIENNIEIIEFSGYSREGSDEVLPHDSLTREIYQYAYDNSNNERVIQENEDTFEHVSCSDIQKCLYAVWDIEGQTVHEELY